MKVITSNEDDNDNGKDNVNIISHKTHYPKKEIKLKFLPDILLLKKEFSLLILLDFTFYIT